MMPTQAAQNPQLQQALQALPDIHLPPPVSQIPAIGWWCLAVLVLSSLVYGFFLIKRWRRLSLYRRQALANVQQLQTQSLSSHELADACNRLLKQVAVQCYGRLAVSRLSGAKWLQFLDNKLGKPVFEQHLLQQWPDYLYQQQDNSEAFNQALLAACQQWINKHQHPHYWSKLLLARTPLAQTEAVDV